MSTCGLLINVFHCVQSAKRKRQVAMISTSAHQERTYWRQQDVHNPYASKMSKYYQCPWNMYKEKGYTLCIPQFKKVYHNSFGITQRLVRIYFYLEYSRKLAED